MKDLNNSGYVFGKNTSDGIIYLGKEDSIQALLKTVRKINPEDKGNICFTPFVVRNLPLQANVQYNLNSSNFKFTDYIWFKIPYNGESKKGQECYSVIENILNEFCNTNFGRDAERYILNYETGINLLIKVPRIEKHYIIHNSKEMYSFLAFILEAFLFLRCPFPELKFEVDLNIFNGSASLNAPTLTPIYETVKDSSTASVSESANQEDEHIINNRNGESKSLQLFLFSNKFHYFLNKLEESKKENLTNATNFLREVKALCPTDKENEKFTIINILNVDEKDQKNVTEEKIDLVIDNNSLFGFNFIYPISNENFLISPINIGRALYPGHSFEEVFEHFHLLEDYLLRNGNVADRIEHWANENFNFKFWHKKTVFSILKNKEFTRTDFLNANDESIFDSIYETFYEEELDVEDEGHKIIKPKEKLTHRLVSEYKTYANIIFNKYFSNLPNMYDLPISDLPECKKTEFIDAIEYLFTERLNLLDRLENKHFTSCINSLLENLPQAREGELINYGYEFWIEERDGYKRIYITYKFVEQFYKRHVPDILKNKPFFERALIELNIATKTTLITNKSNNIIKELFEIKR